jgi:hypothetical protein
MLKKSSYLLVLFAFIVASCNKGLEPEEVLPEGTLIVNILYNSDWPESADIVDFRFVGFKFQPQSEADFVRINEMLISDPLTYGVTNQTLIFEDIPNQRYYMGAIAWQYGPNVFADWRAAAIYTGGNGQFTIEGNTVEITLTVDFNNLPDFP